MVLAYFVLWVVFIPGLIARISQTIALSEFFAHPRAYVEARWQGTLWAYLVSCPECLSHWVGAIMIIIAWGAWPFPSLSDLLNALVCWGFSVQAANRLWKLK